MQNSTDYVIRMKNCDDIISLLKNYISKHPEGELTTSVKTSLMSWQSRKAILEQELNSLSNKLYSQLQDRAIFEAQKVHRMSKVERVNLEERKRETIGIKIHVTDIYAIRMRGTIIGKSIFKLNVTVSGNIDTATKQIFVNDKVKVDE